MNTHLRLELGHGLKWSLSRHQAIWGLLFVAPAVIYFGIFWIYPLLSAIRISFTQWDLFTPPKPVGLENYRALLTDSSIRQTLGATLYYVVGTVVPIPIVALGLALLINRPFAGKSFFSTAFYVPAVMSWIAVSIVWKLIYMPSAGLYLLFVQPFGIREIPWLQSRQWAMPAVLILALWKEAGHIMVLFLAGLQTLPQEVFEAARVDGANALQMLRRITLPLLRPTLLFVMVTMTIGAFQVFTPIYVMTRGGPAHATRVLAMYLYQEAFSNYRMGRASALSLLMAAILIGVTIIQIRAFGERENG